MNVQILQLLQDIRNYLALEIVLLGVIAGLLFVIAWKLNDKD